MFNTDVNVPGCEGLGLRCPIGEIDLDRESTSWCTRCVGETHPLWAVFLQTCIILTYWSGTRVFKRAERKTLVSLAVLLLIVGSHASLLRQDSTDVVRSKASAFCGACTEAAAKLGILCAHGQIWAKTSHLRHCEAPSRIYKLSMFASPDGRNWQAQASRGDQPRRLNA